MNNEKQDNINQIQYEWEEVYNLGRYTWSRPQEDGGIIYSITDNEIRFTDDEVKNSRKHFSHISEKYYAIIWYVEYRNLFVEEVFLDDDITKQKHELELDWYPPGTPTAILHGKNIKELIERTVEKFDS